MIVLITRFVFITAGVLGGLAVTDLTDWTSETGFPEYLVILIFVLLGWSIGYVLGGIIGREFASWYGKLEDHLRDLSPVDIVLGSIGLIGGFLIAWLVSQPLGRLEPLWLSILASSVLYAMAGYVGLRVAVLKRDDIARSFPKLDGGGETSTGTAALSVKLLDTSAVIDARFLDLVHLGVLEGEVRVPRFVLSELQTLADSADDVKRARGRRGLDLLARVPEDERITVFETDYVDTADVDAKLLRLAQDAQATIVTVDYNLTKVANVRGVSVVNLNEIATALKPAFLPGEGLRLRVVREGKETGQGVGYLDDGTMVVVQEGRSHIGDEIDTEVTSVLQTSAGRMIFARLVGALGDIGDG